MLEPLPPTTSRYPRLEAVIEAMDRPLLGLALVAMVLYLLDIRGVTEGWPQTALTVSSFVIDSVFAFDLVLKLVALRAEYVGTPWFLVDLLSSLPVLDTLANGVLPLRAFRFFRGFRVLRIFRGLRVLRALRAVPGFERFSREARVAESTHRAHRAMNLGMLALTAAMIVTIVVVRRSLVQRVPPADRRGGRPGAHGRPSLSNLGGGFDASRRRSVLVRTRGRRRPRPTASTSTSGRSTAGSTSSSSS